MQTLDYLTYSIDMPLTFFFFSLYRLLHYLHSFPTRRSSDLFARAFRLHRFSDVAALHHALSLGAQRRFDAAHSARSEEHTSELQSRGHLVCRLLLEKKKLYD